MSKTKPNFTDINRIANKIRKGDSETATYATQVMTSINQGKKASKPRPRLLTLLIAQYLKDGGESEQNKVLEYLKSQRGKGVIETVTDVEIEWTNSSGKIKDTLVCNLKNYIIGAQQLINSD